MANASVRYIRRVGEILKEFDIQGQRDDLELIDGSDLKLSRGKAAQDVGLSECQTKTAVRIASIPENVFEETTI
jgi:hypothetical protein